MPMRGVKFYIRKFSNSVEEIGFFYSEVISNLLEDAGKNGLTVPELRQRSDIQDPTIRKILKQLLEMRRVTQLKSKQDNNLPQYKYIIKRRWMNIK